MAGIDLSESYLKAKSRSFDLESIFTLQLSGCNLRSLHTCLNQCHDLCTLDLSFNLLTSSSLSVLDGRQLPKLTSLDLSSNRFQSTFEPGFFPTLPALEILHLEGNELKDPNLFQRLKECCPNLRQLYLSKGNQSNPISSNPNYRLDCVSSLPQLQVLDGERLTPQDRAAFYSSFRQLDKETQQYANSSKDASALAAKRTSQELTTLNGQDQQVARKVEDWLPQGQQDMKHSSTWPALLPQGIDSELAPRVNNLRASLKDCARVLSEECDKTLAEFKKYDKDAAMTTGSRASPRLDEQDGNFGTFGDTDE